jgi:hypothetical protein
MAKFYMEKIDESKKAYGDISATYVVKMPPSPSPWKIF